MKKVLLEKVKELLENRMKTSFEAMEAAKNSANEEGKSSAGDKYETARAMGQIDREMNGRMYEQARQERLSLDKIDPDFTPTKVTFGALVETTMGLFFVSVGAGIIEIDGKKIMLISAQAPVGQLINGQEAGYSFTFRGLTQEILSIS